MFRQIAEQMLTHVFYRVSAVVGIGETQRVCSMRMFDTEFGAAYMHVPENAREIWLISNHPEGQISPYEADLEHAERILRAAPGVRLRLFVCGEDIGCIDIAPDGKCVGSSMKQEAE